MTYLFFMKMLDDAQIKKEANAEILKASVDNPVFKEGEQWHNPDTDKDVPYNTLRWHVFKNYEAAQMFNTIRTDVFPFSKNLGEGKEPPLSAPSSALIRKKPFSVTLTFSPIQP